MEKLKEIIIELLKDLLVEVDFYKLYVETIRPVIVKFVDDPDKKWDDLVLAICDGAALIYLKK